MRDQGIWFYNQSLKFLNGQGVAKDPAEAFRLNSESADRGYHDAVLPMGWFYLNGTGVARDRDEAHHWYRQSARQGDARAMFSLGQMAYDDHDFDEAHKWFSRAIDAGHLRSLFWMGKLYWHGRGVPTDKKQAAVLFDRAARAKVPEAQRAVRFLGRRGSRPTRG
ncbi:MAG: tetratricopeptide repeat protein [Terriglobia bacterium]